MSEIKCNNCEYQLNYQELVNEIQSQKKELISQDDKITILEKALDNACVRVRLKDTDFFLDEDEWKQMFIEEAEKE